MDSLTQFALGACVGVAVAGRRAGARKAAMLGGALGTLPDLDVLLPFDDPVDAFVLHRGWTHSIVMHALATPLLGEAARFAVRELRGERAVAWLTVFLCLATHALLDAMTIYGTRLFWPIWTEPLGIGSVFIIDPLYTLPLLFVTLWALARPDCTPNLRRAVAASLVVSTLYLGWGLVAQRAALASASRVLAAAGLAPDRVLAIPTPFNTLFWRVIAVEPDRYFNLYVPLFGAARPDDLSAHPRGAALAACIGGLGAFQRLAAFSKGFYRVDRRDGDLVVSDLRMGLTPDYVFQFAVARGGPGGVTALRPERRVAGRSAPGDLDWLLAGLAGAAVVRPAEAAARPSSQASGC